MAGHRPARGLLGRPAAGEVPRRRVGPQGSRRDARARRAKLEATVTTLWDTTGTAVVKALAAERRTGGGVTSGLALTLVVVMEEKDAAEVEAAVSIAASKHPMRVLMVLRHNI